MPEILHVFSANGGDEPLGKLVLAVFAAGVEQGKEEERRQKSIPATYPLCDARHRSS
ncbi:MAG: hypothetical protein HYV67_02800 [Candidatus Taylorbacteria bacterium]|nr:hypothetical protein [Candidatus Taylorbacteria bacterium]